MSLILKWVIHHHCTQFKEIWQFKDKMLKQNFFHISATMCSILGEAIEIKHTPYS